jgi:hypothetical protein
MKKKIFISYSDLDKSKMNSLAKKIEKSNSLSPIVVAYNRDAMIPLSHKVINGIEESQYIVPILTSKSYKTQWINQEIGFAKAKNKRIIPIVEQQILTHLKGFVNSQMDLSYNFSSTPDNQKKERAAFRKCCDILIFDLESKLKPTKKKTPTPKTLSSIFKGKWINEYEFPDGRKGKESVEIKNGNRYYSNDRFVFELDKIYVSPDLKTIQFRKNGINGDDRKAFNKLELIAPGKYSGTEESNRVIYTKVADDNLLLKRIEKIEEQKLKLSIEPIIRLKTAGRSSSNFFITIENKGENAILERMEVGSGEITLSRINLPATLDKNHRFRIEGVYNNKETIDPDYSLNLYYSDRLQNKYIGTISRTNKRTMIKTKEVD